MKWSRLTALALTSSIALGAFAPAAMADDYRRDDSRHDDRGHHRGHDRHDDRRDRRHYQTAYRDGYHDARRDDRRGHRPPPPHVWARGERYHDYYRGPVVVVHDYPRYHVHRPPRGYHWVRDDRGNLLLVAIASGIIADLLLHH